MLVLVLGHICVADLAQAVERPLCNRAVLVICIILGQRALDGAVNLLGGHFLTARLVICRKIVFQHLVIFIDRSDVFQLFRIILGILQKRLQSLAVRAAIGEVGLKCIAFITYNVKFIGVFAVIALKLAVCIF